MKRLLVIFLVLCAVAVVAALGGILLAGRGSLRARGADTVLVWRLRGPIAEQPPAPRLPLLPGYQPPLSLGTVHRALARARRDERLRGAALYIEEAQLDLAQAQEVRDLLAALRAGGKEVRCYLETAGEATNGTLPYYLASACGRIVLAPAGEVNLLGLWADSPFLRGALDKLKIQPDVHHVGPYKSAGEVFTEQEHSAAAEEALGAVLDSLYGQIVAGIAKGRGLAPIEVREIVDSAPHAAARALELRLVDELAYPDQFRAQIEELAGGEAGLVELADYARRDGAPLRRAPRVAILFAEGTILRGEGGFSPWSEESFLGAVETAANLRELAEDDAIAAVVLRIQSPGGSAMASDLILREVERLDERKPVVVSMSGLAASGGYYIASKARRIVAQPATLTGSIGVVGGKLATRAFQEELLGVTHDPLSRGANAGFYNPLDPFTPEQAVRFQEQMQGIYETFLGHVAAGRKLAPEAVAGVAGGRLWTGEDALARGLVDRLGGIETALELAREAAGVAAEAEVELAFYPEPQSFLDLLLRRERPALPSELRALLRAAAPRPPLALELPDELRALARPF